MSSTRLILSSTHVLRGNTYEVQCRQIPLTKMTGEGGIILTDEYEVQIICVTNDFETGRTHKMSSRDGAVAMFNQLDDRMYRIVLESEFEPKPFGPIPDNYGDW